MHTPCERKTCQYVVERDNIMMPNTTRKFPTRSMERKYPKSNKGPDMTPKKMRRKACTVPIHDIDDWELDLRRISR
jgi:hypothetical protein